MSYGGKVHASREKYDATRTGKRSGWNPNWKKAPPVERGSAYKPIVNPSAEQRAIFMHVASSPNHLVVQALAGTGKTATIVEAMCKYVPPGKSMLYVIFANRNAREAESKCHAGIQVRTCHAFGLAALKAAYGSKVEVDAKGEKVRNIAQALLGPEDEKVELRFNFCKAVSLAKGYLCSDVESVLAVMTKHEIEVNLDQTSEDDFASNVLKALELSAQQYMRVDFDDMIWLPIKRNVSIPKYDYVFPDEVQDLSPARRELVKRAVALNGKMVAVGDKNQAIFGWTGADSASMENTRTEMDADVLHLSTTYRCAKSIVAVAQATVPEYVAYEGNAEGEVTNKSLDMMQKPANEGGAAPGDFILSRVNAPLVKLCMQFVREGRKANIQGRDVGKNLTYMLKRSKAASVSGFLMWLDTWESNECQKLAERNKPIDAITDKADCLRVFCEGETSLEAVKANIESMFADEEPGKPETGIIRLSSIHRAKGLEADRVWLLTYTFTPVGPDEENVWYVGVTRARHSLYMVRKAL